MKLLDRCPRLDIFPRPAVPLYSLRDSELKPSQQRGLRPRFGRSAVLAKRQRIETPTQIHAGTKRHVPLYSLRDSELKRRGIPGSGCRFVPLYSLRDSELKRATPAHGAQLGPFGSSAVLAKRQRIETFRPSVALTTATVPLYSLRDSELKQSALTQASRDDWFRCTR